MEEVVECFCEQDAAAAVCCVFIHEPSVFLNKLSDAECESDATHERGAICFSPRSPSTPSSCHECEGTSTGNQTFSLELFFSPSEASLEKEVTAGVVLNTVPILSLTFAVGNVSAAGQQGRSHQFVAEIRTTTIVFFQGPRT